MASVSDQPQFNNGAMLPINPSEFVCDKHSPRCSVQTISGVAITDELKRERCTCQAPLERITQFFTHKHLPGHLQVVSQKFYLLVWDIVDVIPRSPERTVALRKMLESKDAAVRAALYQGLCPKPKSP